MTKTILLTGGTGFLGSNLLKRLLAGGYSVVLLKRTTSSLFRIQPFLPRIRYYDIDRQPLERVFQENKINFVLHCATDYGRRQIPATEILQANLTLPLHLLQLAVEHGSEAFINTDTILDKRVSDYSLSKRQFGEWLSVFSEKISCINVALEHFYGPYDDSSKFVSSIILSLLENRPEIELTAGTQKRDFIYIDDVSEAFMKIMASISTRSCGLQRFEVGSGQNIAIRDLVELIRGLAGNTSTKLNFGALTFRKNEVMESRVDGTALAQLGWSARISLAEGLCRTIALEKERLKK